MSESGSSGYRTVSSDDLLPASGTRSEGQLPFSPTSPGVRSPGRPRTMKEYEEDLASLKKENFNLKVRIYFLEQHRVDPSVPKDVDELRNLYTNLKVEHDLQKNDLETKENLLLDTYKALDVQKQQLETVTEERRLLLSKVEHLEKELKEYQQRFMETSVPLLDDTAALYTMAFGLNAKTDSVQPDPQAEEKIRELQEELAKEKERVSLLEEEMSLLKEKTVDDKKNVQKLVLQLQDMEDKLRNILKEKNRIEEMLSKSSSLVSKLEKNIKQKTGVLTEKEAEAEKWKNIAEELRKQLTVAENQRQELEERISKLPNEKQIKMICAEREKLRQEVKYLQTLAEKNLAKLRNSEPDAELKDALQRETDLRRKLDTYKGQLESSKHMMQEWYKEKNRLQLQIEKLKQRSLRNHSANSAGSSKEEVKTFIEAEKEMSAEKDKLVSELQGKIQELTEAIAAKDCQLQELRDKLESLPSSPKSKCDSSLQFPEEGTSEKDKDNEIVIKEIQEKNKEIENLKKELKKKTFNLQGLVNKELWDKNREIEKLNKLCERQHVERLSLERKLRDCQLSMMEEKVFTSTATANFQRGIFDDKENLQPIADSRIQIQNLMEEKRQLQRKVEELQSRLLNTPERDKESEQLQTLRAEAEAAEKQRKEAVNACVLLTTRLQELADFLESLLPLLCGKRRRYVQQAVERSRELSRSLSIAAEESSLLQCSAWTDLQPSLVVPLLPDISTVDFWSGDEAEAEEPFSAAEDASNLSGKPRPDNSSGNPFLDSVFNFDGKSFSIENKTEENSFSEILLADIAEGSLAETCSEGMLQLDKSCSRVTPAKSANIGRIILTSKKKEVEGGEASKPREECLSECETWSEPDRDVSYARMGLKEDPVLSKSTHLGFDDTSETAESTPKSPLSRRGSEIQRMQRKIRNLEQVNAALRSELVILHQLTPPTSSRQDKATSVEGEPDKTLIARLKEITNQLESTENEAAGLKKEKENLSTKVEFLHTSLQKTTDELMEKQEALEKLEKETSRQIDELTHTVAELNDQIIKLRREIDDHLFEGKKNKQLIDELNMKVQQLDRQKDELQRLTAEQEQLLADAERERQELATQLIARDREVGELSKRLSCVELTSGELEAALRSQLELATQQCAQFESKIRDLDCSNKRREDAVADLQRRLDSARFAHSEAVLQYTRVANDNIRLQQELRARAYAANNAAAANQMAQVERMKGELEHRVAELEAANVELEAKLASLNILRHPMSDYETDAGSSVVGSPRRTHPPPLTLHSPTRPPPFTLPSPNRPPPLNSPARSHDLTSDYISDQEAALSSPQSQVRGLWYSTSPHSHTSASPDLGIESDHGRFSSLDTQPKSTAVSLRGTPVKDLMKLEEENTQLRMNLQKTRHALEETLAQLTAANQHKRQYEAQLSAANQHKAKVEKAICRQLHKTHSILKKARVNLEEDGKSDRL